MVHIVWNLASVWSAPTSTKIAGSCATGSKCRRSQIELHDSLAPSLGPPNAHNCFAIENHQRTASSCVMKVVNTNPRCGRLLGGLLSKVFCALRSAVVLLSTCVSCLVSHALSPDFAHLECQRLMRVLPFMLPPFTCCTRRLPQKAFFSCSNSLTGTFLKALHGRTKHQFKIFCHNEMMQSVPLWRCLSGLTHLLGSSVRDSAK